MAHLRPLWQAMMGLGVLVIALDVTGIITPPGELWWIIGVIGWVLLAYLLYRVAPTTDTTTSIIVNPPISGRWQVHNSTGQKVPSHGTKTRGQHYAVDITHPTVAEDMITPLNPLSPRKALRGNRPEEFTCFGQPIHAMANGVVVKASDWQRDQRARNTWQALLWTVLVEGFARELVGGHRAVLGNHLVIKHEDGVYAAYAHLRKGSVRVKFGDRVETGDIIAEVGNTGNTTEPHLHVQLMDRASFDAAAGLPMVWQHFVVEGLDPAWEKHAQEPEDTALPAMPRNGTIVRTCIAPNLERPG
ncbi:M23 family metallopeptidase [Auritidibacter ignavus]|uniref:M23 family metallopeptidase n=1 Tax=Auritidibacter ignavus TaxID=678932 RepID=UPI0024491F38|nr:M23 family metallopeptidase [Auritidibacter ignavus]WGH90308.1 M23 family metallopeptidase [Auritidibacter ignavus]